MHASAARRIMISGALALLTIAALGTASSAGAAAGTVEGTPHLDHVFTIVLENENLAATWNTDGSYLHGLLAKGVFANQYYATSHVSADNYMAMTSGQSPTPLFNTDCLDWGACETWEQNRLDGGVSVADQLDAAHKTWKAYMDAMGTPCKHPAPDTPTSPVNLDPYQVGYATRHDPFVYYPPIVNNQSYCDAHVVDYSRLASDLASETTTPNYAFITPDTCHDGHDAPCTGPDALGPGGKQGGLVSANAWMSVEVPKILASPAFTTPGVASVLFITTDEAANTDVTGCTTGPPLNGGTPGTCSSGVTATGVDGGGLVGLLAIGSPDAHVASGTTATPYDHNSLLRTIEDGLGLGPLTAPNTSTVISQDSAGHLNGAGSPLEHAMASLFAPEPATTTPPPASASGGSQTVAPSQASTTPASASSTRAATVAAATPARCVVSFAGVDPYRARTGALSSVIRCDQAAAVTLTDVATIGDTPTGPGKKKTTTLGLGSAKMRVGANVRAPITLRLSSRRRRALLAASRRGARIVVSSSLVAVDDAGNRTTARAFIGRLRV
jgi:hypothetical protein